MKFVYFSLFFICCTAFVFAQHGSLSTRSSSQSVFLSADHISKTNYSWKFKKVSEIQVSPEKLSSAGYTAADWMPAVVPGTVLNSLVANKVYPDPYFGDNNRKERGIIPDLNDAGVEFYHYWFRTEFDIPANFRDKKIWLKFNGINYRSEIWLNGKNIGTMAGMFNSRQFDITELANRKGKNILAVKVKPVDIPGSSNRSKNVRAGAVGENANGGDGEMGKNVSMLMSVGWDFTAPDGIRDRNTGIWREVELFASGPVLIEHVFVMSKLPLPDTTSAEETIKLDLVNSTNRQQRGVLSVQVKDAGISFSKAVTLKAGERRSITLTPNEFKQLRIRVPKLWWPLNKGNQHLYRLDLKFTADGASSAGTVASTRFGIREISTDQQTPDRSRRFLVNGHPVFIRGSNWVPEAMLRNSVSRTYAELRYTRQAGINFLRLWGGGIAESDYFYQLCDEFGILVWSEFWITGDTRFPTDTALYFANLESTVKRIRNHASSAYYVSANESTEIKGAAELIHRLDPTKGYQPQSECCGIHDGSPYKYENPMQYFENTASKRGSRVDGFNPEYGAPILPILSSLKELMPEKDLWPANNAVWSYLDGGGFHQMTTKYREAVEQFGKPGSLDDYAKKAQFVGAMNFRAIWEVWNYNKFGYGDRFASGLLFWYHNSPVPQTSARFYDWFLEPTAGLYYTQNGLAPLHPQFDYFKNTVSVYNDYRRAFKGYKLKATVYNMDSKEMLTMDSTINIPADGLNKDVFKITFPKNITQVHFIKLVLTDNSGKFVADAFYWRSNDEYKGAWTMTGPAVSGFQEINQLNKTTLNTQASQTRSAEKITIKANVKNTGTSLSFFTQLRLADQDGKSIKPAFYSDNFFNLLPGEQKMVQIEIPADLIQNKVIRLFTGGFNGADQEVILQK
ncbi:glycosyl hydrolase 2 galactose-binding domain-containing protein [Pedobacter metabolipauper]|uniref:Glycosyl hydrolase family 2 n=1 Tax=Pedobacter metabolipauper TaxID=425513 RepID=A0A4V3D0X1_9SPHI|nr:sugar-binding domain-containing protein [Pedobacter metabolipauper]TDQ08084.1 glycosyl hydrolase family 2 [Pedobacter metabolipauper]